MPASDKSRKILWAKSGNRCAFCRVKLVVEKTEVDSESVVGEECHIVSGAPTGPRHDASYPNEKIDSVDNLILLCATHHKMVDDQQETYTASVLSSIKRNHETWVESKLRDEPTPPPVRIRRIKENIPEHLPRVTSGKELLAMLSGSMAHYFDHDEQLSPAEVDLVGGFGQALADWIDVSSDLEAIERIRATQSIHEQIAQLESSGFWVFAAREIQRLEGGRSGPSAWPVVHVAVQRSSSPDIRAVPMETAKKPNEEDAKGS